MNNYARVPVNFGKKDAKKRRDAALSAVTGVLDNHQGFPSLEALKREIKFN